MIIDTSSSCKNKFPFLVDRGVEYIGRYYSSFARNTKVIKRDEAQAICSHGIKIFTVFEDWGDESKLELTEDNGARHGITAKDQAKNIGQPHGSVIYFAVEGLPQGYKQKDLASIMTYFAGVKKSLGSNFSAGVYGDGAVCKKLLDEGICSHTWLAQASWSFEGTKEFYKSKRWSLAQIVVDQPKKLWKQLSVDVNEGSTDIGAFAVSLDKPKKPAPKPSRRRARHVQA